MPHLLLALKDFLHQSNFKNAALEFVDDRSIIWGWVRDLWNSFMEWISQPHVLLFIMVWWITFTVIMTIFMTLGFGPAGIVAEETAIIRYHSANTLGFATGSLAAAFQSWMYGGFTPAGGIFATLTSAGMLGIAMPPYAAAAGGIATMVAGISIFIF